MATGKVVISNDYQKVEVDSIEDGYAFEYNDVIYIKNAVVDSKGGEYYRGFSICGYCILKSNELVTPVDLEIKVIR